MIYYYRIGICYHKNNKKIIREYKNISFLDILDLLTKIDKKHKGNYEIVYIKCDDYYRRYRL